MVKSYSYCGDAAVPRGEGGCCCGGGAERRGASCCCGAAGGLVDWPAECGECPPGSCARTGSGRGGTPPPCRSRGPAGAASQR